MAGERWFKWSGGRRGAEGGPSLAPAFPPRRLPPSDFPTLMTARSLYDSERLAAAYDFDVALAAWAGPSIQAVFHAAGNPAGIRIRRSLAAVILGVASSAMVAVLMLVAAQGTKITVRARGEDAHTALASLAELINNKFGED